MKKLFRLAAVAAMLFASSCSESYDDSALLGRVDDLENRVARLEELCRQMNTNITSLQTLVSALQEHDCITSMTPVESDGIVIGYTITFSQHAPVTIYHGKNGTDGTNGSDGKDGIAPVIGVKQDTDGAYYWTLDGEWLLDENGAKIRTQGPNGNDGADGTPGEDGADGKDGITPQLKIEEDYWYVSTDNGATWTKLGKATGENGKDGADSSDSIFKNITQDDDNIYFALKNGENIVLPKKQQLAITFAGGNSLQFDIDEAKTINYTITGGGANNVVKAEMLNLDGNYTLYTTSTSATKGTIKITAKIPTANNVIVSVSDGKQTIMAAIAVSIKPSLEENVITVETPGTLSKLLADYDKSSITELTVLGNLNDSDIWTLFYLPNLAALDLENVNLETLQNGAFRDKTSLTSVKLPRTLKTIDNLAFSGCSGLTGNLVIPDGVTSIGNGAFSGCSGLTGDLVIPAGVTSIGDLAFSSCSGLTGNLVIPDGVTSIGNSVFSGCSGLTGDLVIPDGVTSIGGYTFQNCSGFTGNLVIPAGVTSIGSYAFRNCSGFTAVYCKAVTPPSAASDSFSGIKSRQLYVPVGSTDAYRAAARWNWFTNINEMEFE